MDSATTDKELRHVVLVAFKSTSSAEDIERAVQAFALLPNEIKEIIDFEWGTDVSVEGAAQGYTHCFLVTFGDATGRDVYLPHPAHKAFVQLIGPHLEKVLVLDYWARR